MKGQRQVSQYLAALEAAARDCDTLDIDGSTPLILQGDEQCLAVLCGAVDLFAVHRRPDNQPGGNRYPLGRAEQGELVFGLPAASADRTPLSLMAVGVVGTRVARDIPLAQLDTPHLCALVDRSLTGLSANLQHAQPPPRHRQLHHPIDYLEVVPDVALFAAERRPLWIGTASETAFDLHGLVQVHTTLLPVTGFMWAKILDAHHCELLSTRQLAQKHDLVGEFRRFLRLFAGALEQSLAIEEAARRARLQQARERDEAALTAALQDMATTLATASPRPADRGVAQSSTLSALRLVAQAQGISLRVPDYQAHGLRQSTEIEAIATVSDFRTREVVLRQGWWRLDAGPLLGYTVDDLEPVALLRHKGGYQSVDPSTQERVPVTAEVAASLSVKATMLYRGFPAKIDGLRGLLRIMGSAIWRDSGRILAAGLAIGALAALTPLFTAVLIDGVIPRADLPQHWQIVACLVAIALGTAAFEIVRSIAFLRLGGRIDLYLQAAVFDRLMRLPVSFFVRFSSGDLAERAMGFNEIRTLLSSTALSAMLGLVFSVFSLVLMFIYSWQMALLGVLLIGFSLIVALVLSRWQLRYARLTIQHRGQVESFSAQMLSGIAKLRVAAAEVRAYAHWLHLFSRQKHRFVDAQRIGNLQDVFNSVYPVLSTVLVFLGVVALTDSGSALSIGIFIAFYAAFGQLTAAVRALASAVTQALYIVPLYERVRPILEQSLEDASGDLISKSLRGDIELSQIDFRYAAGGDLILDNVSLQIQAGEFVAIVGPSGSGKSTLLRLLLGFEHADKGQILFDGIPASKLDMAAMRRQTGVVLQNGKLITGSIFTNIVGNSTLTLADAKRAARQVGMGIDIDNMPMGMHTVVTEGVNTLSGGQRQRLMIARALVRKPRILFLDEATSALDNRTQEIVTTTLSELDATRIVIAHRLSTIRMADRILVLDQGRLVQQGTFEELMAAPGPFYALAERQLA